MSEPGCSDFIVRTECRRLFPLVAAHMHLKIVRPGWSITTGTWQLQVTYEKIEHLMILVEDNESTLHLECTSDSLALELVKAVRLAFVDGPGWSITAGTWQLRENRASNDIGPRQWVKSLFQISKWLTGVGICDSCQSDLRRWTRVINNHGYMAVTRR